MRVSRLGDVTDRQQANLLPAAVVALTLLYAAPHLWWMVGVSLGFPGDATEFDDAFQRVWFSIYNLITTGMVMAGAAFIILLERKVTTNWRRALWILVLSGAILLLLRGALGVATSTPYTGPPASMVWELWFLVTGVLYAAVAWRSRDSRRISTARGR